MTNHDIYGTEDGEEIVLPLEDYEKLIEDNERLAEENCMLKDQVKELKGALSVHIRQWTIHTFSKVGRFHTEVKISIPANTASWDLKAILLEQLPGLKGSNQHALCMEGPWGYPVLLLDL